MSSICLHKVAWFERERERDRAQMSILFLAPIIGFAICLKQRCGNGAQKLDVNGLDVSGTTMSTPRGLVYFRGSECWHCLTT